MPSRLFRIATSFTVGSIVMLAGAAFTWFQVTQSELDGSALAARQALQISEQIIEDARSAASLARPYLSRPCTSDVRMELGRLVIGIQHIRVISLFRRTEMTCSSWPGALAAKEDIPAGTGHTVTMLNDDYITPGIAVLVLRSHFSEGVVTASLPTKPLAEALRLLSIHRSLSLRAGDMSLSADNKLHNLIKSENQNAVSSDRYPIWVTYDGSHSVPLAQIIREGYLSLTLSVLLGIMAAIGLWLFAFRPYTPYEELAFAIEKGELVPWYQPVIDANSGTITGVEVLARLVKPDGTVVPPDRFIPLAESSDLIIPLTRSLMKQAARELSELLKCTTSCWHIGINVTQAHVLAPGFIDECLTFVRNFASGKVTLTIELSEREPFDSSADMQKKLKELHENSIAVALDDFGTGYANLEYISEVNVNIIKIDRAFVKRIGTGQSSERLLSSVIEMARALNLLIVAEGIETKEQAAWLTSRGIKWQQGYFYSPPVPIHRLADLTESA